MTWNNFKREWNSWGNLEWIVEEPSLNTTFLDLSFLLGPPSQLPPSNYLYIPPLSSHPLAA
jgi:hypothetical protein